MAFAHHRQPRKLVYLVYKWLYILVLLPYWFFISFIPSQCPPSWSSARFVMINALSSRLEMVMETSTDVFNTNPEKVEESGEDVGLVWIRPDPNLVVGDISRAARLNGVSAIRVAGYWYGARDVDGKAGQPAGPDEKVIYNIHGGGWVVGSAHPSWMTGYMTRQMLVYSEGYTRAFQIEYRLSQAAPLAPQGAFPAAIIDVITGYNYLVNILGFKPSNILLSGESVGANFAIALVRYCLSASLPSLPPPHAMFLHSPACDFGLTHSGVNSSMNINSRTDYIQAFFDGYSANAYLGDLPKSELCTNPWISPASLGLSKSSGLFFGFPPTLMITGAAEIMLDSLHTLRDRMVADMGEDKFKYVEVTDGTHVLMSWDFYGPENTGAYEEYGQWLKQVQ